MWQQLIIAVIMMVASYYLTPKPKAQKVNALKPTEVTTPTATAGAPIQVVFGTVWIKNPNTLWVGGQRSSAIWK